MPNNMPDTEEHIARAGTLREHNAREISEQFISNIPPYPGSYEGRGIVICAGGTTYLANAWVCINMLRHFGCSLPIQLWHRGETEIDQAMKDLLRPLGVECIDAMEVRESHPARILNGWEIKPYSILHCPFKEVMLLDADNMPVVNPEFLFETQEFRETGAIFWPDFNKLASKRKIWSICGVPYRYEPEFESGQIVVNKEKCWAALNLTMWYNEHSDFYYCHIHGDKETFHMAFRKLDVPYSMPKRPIHSLGGVMCQHDFEGKRIFQHRNLAKWKLHLENRRIPCFLHENECLMYLDQLKAAWEGRLNGVRRFKRADRNDPERMIADEITKGRYAYNRLGHDHRAMSFLPDGLVGEGAADCECYWDVRQSERGVILDISSHDKLTCSLRQDADGVWRGRWVRFERMRVELSRESVTNQAAHFQLPGTSRNN